VKGAYHLDKTKGAARESCKCAGLAGPGSINSPGMERHPSNERPNKHRLLFYCIANNINIRGTGLSLSFFLQLLDTFRVAICLEFALYM
jgi:hypothetical protein